MNQNQQQHYDKQQMSKEELTKTQVLNLQALQEAANYEKKTSKKPAITLASIGLFAIFIGIIYNPIVAFVSGTEIEDNNSSNTKVVAQKVQEETLTCIQQALGNPNGTDYEISYNMIFDDSKLQSYTKSFTANIIVGNALGATAIQGYTAANMPYDLATVPGYTVKTEQTSLGMKTTTSINLMKLDKTLVPETHKNYNITNPEFDLNTDKTAIQTYLNTAGYTCK